MAGWEDEEILDLQGNPDETATRGLSAWMANLVLLDKKEVRGQLDQKAIRVTKERLDHGPLTQACTVIRYPSRVTKARPVHQVLQAHPDPLGQEVLLETRGRTDPGVPLENKVPLGTMDIRD